MPLSLERRWKAHADAGLEQHAVARNGEPIIVPSQDVVLGLLHAPRDAARAGMMFPTSRKARGRRIRQIDLSPASPFASANTNRGTATRGTRSRRSIRHHGRPSLLSEILPEGCRSRSSIKPLKKKEISPADHDELPPLRPQGTVVSPTS